jgi:hypothetical protein
VTCFIWGDWWLPRNISVRIFDNAVGIRRGCLSGTSLDSHHYNSVFGWLVGGSKMWTGNLSREASRLCLCRKFGWKETQMDALERVPRKQCRAVCCGRLHRTDCGDFSVFYAMWRERLCCSDAYKDLPTTCVIIGRLTENYAGFRLAALYHTAVRDAVARLRAATVNTCSHDTRLCHNVSSSKMSQCWLVSTQPQSHSVPRHYAY